MYSSMRRLYISIRTQQQSGAYEEIMSMFKIRNMLLTMTFMFHFVQMGSSVMGKSLVVYQYHDFDTNNNDNNNISKSKIYELGSFVRILRYTL